eukprot:GGOE01014533.1.p1 GENE.GGOE01014533.1~~GGOE01014533.1.p1  ORF type:complete len:320 (-),score=83.19 GGOE01014533.1:72-974(-)
MSAGSKWNRTGTLAGLTDEQCGAALEELRGRIGDLLPIAQHDPHFLSEEGALINFLIARRYDIRQAEEMLRRWAEWRRTNDITALLHTVDFPEIYKTHYEVAFSGHDRDGNPLYLELPNGPLVAKLMKSQSYEQLLRLHNYTMERRRELAKHWGMDQTSVILDAKDVDLWTYTNSTVMQTLQKFAVHDQEYYPESLRHMFCINVPWAASIIWRFVAPWLDPRVSRKVHLWSAAEWRQRIAEFVPDEGLPARLGGKAEGWFPIVEPGAYRIPDPPPSLSLLPHRTSDPETKAPVRSTVPEG